MKDKHNRKVYYYFTITTTKDELKQTMPLLLASLRLGQDVGWKHDFALNK